MYKLIIEDDEGHTTVVPLVKEEITIGRKEGNTIRLTERNVSRHHARLIKNNGSVFIEDLDSYNGVKVNGDKITARTTIREGDLVEIGDYHFALQWVGEEPPKIKEIVSPESPPPVPAAAATQSDGATAVLRVPVEEKKDPDAGRIRDIPDPEAGRLVVTSTELKGQEFKLSRTEMILGRTQDCDVVLPHRSVSSHHAKIVFDAGVYRIIDMDSANGVLVNGEEYSRVDLRKGDTVELGHVRIRYASAGDAVKPVEDAIEPGTGRALVDAEAVESEIVIPTKGGKKFFLVGFVAVVLTVGAFAIYHFSKTGDGENDDPSGGVENTNGPQQSPAAEDYNLGLTRMKDYDFAGAVAAFETGMHKDAEYPGLSVQLEKATKEKEIGEALQKAKKAIEEKNYDEALDLVNNLPTSMTETVFAGEIKELKPVLEERYIAFHLNKAEKFMESGQLDKAKKHVGSVMFLDEDNALAKRLSRSIKRRERKTSPAVAEVNGDPSTQPKKPKKDRGKSKVAQARELTRRGVELTKEGKSAEAVKVFQKAVKLNPKQCTLYINIGVCYMNMGRAETAAGYYEKFIQVCPDHPSAPHVRKTLEAYRKIR